MSALPPAELVSNLQAISDRLLAAGTAPRLEDVAREVGVSRASLYYWFSGQDELVAFLLTSHARAGAAAVDDAVDASAPPTTRLRRTVVAMVRYLDAHPGTCAGPTNSSTASCHPRESVVTHGAAPVVLTPRRSLRWSVRRPPTRLRAP